MTKNPHKARWALRRAAEYEQLLLDLPRAKAGDWRDRVRVAKRADWLRAEASRFRAMARRWEPDRVA